MNLTNASAQVVPLAGHHRASREYRTARADGSLDWLLIYTKQGQGFARGADGSVSLLPGDLLLIEPKFSHEYGCSPTSIWDFLYVHFLSRPDWGMAISSMEKISPGHRLLRIPRTVRSVVVRTFAEIIRDVKMHTSYGDLLAMHHIERLFLAIYRCSVPKAEQLLDSRILRVTQYIEDHLDSPLQLEDLAERSGMSKSRLAHLFSAQVGDTPHRYIMTRRMKKACDLLKTTKLTIAEIAYRTGFSNPGHFAQQFTRRARCSPGKYRLFGPPIIWTPNAS